MSNTVIMVEGLGKQYNIGALHSKQEHDTLRDKLASGFKSTKKHLAHRKSIMLGTEKFWALRDVSFEVKRGEVLGIIGKNGAGKSTLLKILCKVTSPTEGKAILKGRVGSLLEVGTGFHQELTGRENIYLSGAILGMDKAYINRKEDEIIDFSGIEKFIDTPVKRYSSGMKVRLGFAVAAHLEPEILLIDEVLAVGDSGFQKKCLSKMDNVTQEGRTILLVSHNMAAVQSLCSSALLIEKGQLVLNADTSNVVSKYLNTSGAQGTGDFAYHVDRDLLESSKNDLIEVKNIELVSDGSKIRDFGTGEPLELIIEFFANKILRNIAFYVIFKSILGVRVFAISTNPISGYTIDYLPFGKGSIKLKIPQFPITAGICNIDIGVCREGENRKDWYLDLRDVIKLNISPRSVYGSSTVPVNQKRGLVYVPHEWKLLKT